VIKRLRRFPDELGNVSFDFTDFQAFKYLALKDALDALKMLRMMQFAPHDSGNQRQEYISEMMPQVHKKEKLSSVLKGLAIVRAEL
jgi:hypothetical protein